VNPPGGYKLKMKNINFKNYDREGKPIQINQQREN
jgi:hypothetical protein